MEMVTTERTEAAMAEWSDGRLDEFAVRVDERFDRTDERVAERFDRLDERFDQKCEEVGGRFGAADRRFDKVDRELERINDRLDDLVKVMIAGLVTLTGGIIAGFAAMIVLIATQL
jgi:archaellum component FlaC